MKKHLVAIGTIMIGLNLIGGEIDGSAVLGSAIGAAAGTAVGSAVGGKEGAVIGGGIGGAVGAAAGSKSTTSQPAAQVRVNAAPAQTVIIRDERRHDNGKHKGQYKHHDR
ncbi:MAG: hypothetical protein AB7S65_03075 [Sulfuricurvum sp.]